MKLLLLSGCLDDIKEAALGRCVILALRDLSPLIIGDEDFCFLDDWSVEGKGLLMPLFLAGPSCLAMVALL